MNATDQSTAAWFCFPVERSDIKIGVQAAVFSGLSQHERNLSIHDIVITHTKPL